MIFVCCSKRSLGLFAPQCRALFCGFAFFLVYKGRQKFHDLNCTSPEKKNHTEIVNQILLFSGGFSWRDPTSFQGTFQISKGKDLGRKLDGILVPVPRPLTCKLVSKSHALFKVFCSYEYGVDKGQTSGHVWYNFGVF